MDKPFSPSCERNREPIFEVLKEYLSEKKHLLEIGSGTGQHASYFAPEFPHLKWTTADDENNHPSIRAWIDDLDIDGPLRYLAGKDSFPLVGADVVFTANTLHIMSWNDACVLFQDLGKSLESGAHFLVYGPFNYNGQYTSESNANFDIWLKERNPHSAIRQFEETRQELAEQGFSLVKDHMMPANNRLLAFIKN